MEIKNLDKLQKWRVSFTPTLDETPPASFLEWCLEEPILSYKEWLEALLLIQKNLTADEMQLFQYIAAYFTEQDGLPWKQTPEGSNHEITYLIVNRERLEALLKKVAADPKASAYLDDHLVRALRYLDQIEPRYKGIRLQMEWGWG